MSKRTDTREQVDVFPTDELPTNISRRRFLLASAGATAGAFVLGFGIPVGRARAMGAAAAAADAQNIRVPAFLEIRPDNTIRLQSPFNEGGQGVFTAMAQIVGEELDADPATFVVENAPSGKPFAIMPNGMRITGGSMSVRSGYAPMRRLGALARRMLLQAGAKRLNVPVDELTTEPGRIVHAASGQSLTYGQVAPQALDLPVPDPDSVTLKDPSQFRWIGKPVKRLDAYDKSTGRVTYAIDTQVEGMLQAAVQHAPRLGMTVGTIRNEAQIKAMKGVHSVHRLAGCRRRGRRALVERQAAPWKPHRWTGRNPSPTRRRATCRPISRPRPSASGWPTSRATARRRKPKATSARR